MNISNFASSLSVMFCACRYRTPWSDSTGLGRVPFRATKPHTQYHYGSVVTHGERHPLGGFAEFPQEVGQRNGGGARVERIDKIPLAGKLKVRFVTFGFFLFFIIILSFAAFTCPLIPRDVMRKIKVEFHWVLSSFFSPTKNSMKDMI